MISFRDHIGEQKSRGTLLLGVVVGLIAGIVMATTLVPTKARAAEIGTGCHVGLQAGMSFGDTKISQGLFSIDGVGSRTHDGIGGIAAGCDVKVTNSKLVFGVFGDYNWGKNEFSVNPALFSASLDKTYSLGARVGVQVGSALPYVLIAYTHSDANWSVASAALPTSFHGISYGVGTEFAVQQQISLALEARWTRYESETIGTGVGAPSLEPDTLTAMARLNFRFGGPTASSPFAAPAERSPPLK